MAGRSMGSPTFYPPPRHLGLRTMTFFISWAVLISCAHGAAHSPEESMRCPTCPYFMPTPNHVTTPEGVAANLTCGVRHLADRKVSWIRRGDLHVLTTGTFTYTTDTRFRALHLPGSPYWSLQVDKPFVNDSGVYECQVSTQPKMFRRFSLTVVVPTASISGTQEMFMKAGSDINITCVVKGAIRGAPISWYHVLPRHRTEEAVEEISSSDRGGVQLVTDKHEGTSWLLVTRATWRDAGNYTCAPAHAKPATVSIHVLDEETPRAMQHDLQPSAGHLSAAPMMQALQLLLLLLVLPFDATRTTLSSFCWLSSLPYFLVGFNYWSTDGVTPSMSPPSTKNLTTSTLFGSL